MEKHLFRLQVAPRTVREWHPLEEMLSFLRLAMRETDKSLSATERFSSAMQQFRDASEGFQGAGAAIEDIARDCQPLNEILNRRPFQLNDLKV